MSNFNNRISYLYHYYESNIGPFVNISELPDNDAESVLYNIKNKNTTFAAKRDSNYIKLRRNLENLAREFFIKKGGHPKREVPHYMTLGPCSWLNEWYEHGNEIHIHIDMFDKDIISFTYGDLFPTMRYEDEKPYRKIIYTKDEIYSIIQKFGLPQNWNKDGKHGPERYIEAQIWDDEPIKKFYAKK